MNAEIFGSNNSIVRIDYYKSLANGKIEQDAPRLFIESVKQGEIDMAKIILPYINSEQKDSIHLLYKGRYY